MLIRDIIYKNDVLRVGSMSSGMRDTIIYTLNDMRFVFTRSDLFCPDKDIPCEVTDAERKN